MPVSENSVLLLYGTSACHLCDEAAAMLEAMRALAPGLCVARVDIADSDALFARYALVIPVLRRADGAELHWPFTPEALQRFLA